MNHSRLGRFAITVGMLFLPTRATLFADSQDGFAPMAGEIKARGVLDRTSSYPPGWRLRLEKPIHLDGKKVSVVEVIEPSPAPASPLRNGEQVEFTGRLNPKCHRPSLRVTTIRKLDAPRSAHR